MEIDLRRLQRQAAEGADRHRNLSSLRTAVSIVLDDARPQLEPVRAELDAASVAAGIPLHVTLLFPFVPRAQLDGRVTRSLVDFFASRAPFALELVGIGAFPGVVYAVPTPEMLLQEWIGALGASFPDFPPYGGQFDDVVPHATLGKCDDGQGQAELVERARQLTDGLFPLACAIDDVALLDEHAPDRWRELRRFPLEGSVG